VRVWVEYYEKNHKKKPLDPEDHIFPNISANGTVQPHVAMTHDYVQAQLDIWAEKSGVLKMITGVLTTHGFRRGSAQFHFLVLHWKLTLVRWWGGWAPGEHVCGRCYSFVNN
jgi:hypothetical protein